MNDGLKKHRVSVKLEVELDIYDNWGPDETSDLIAQVLYNWYSYAKADRDSMTVWQNGAHVMEAKNND